MTFDMGRFSTEELLVLAKGTLAFMPRAPGIYRPLNDVILAELVRRQNKAPPSEGPWPITLAPAGIEELRTAFRTLAANGAACTALGSVTSAQFFSEALADVCELLNATTQARGRALN